MKEKWIKWIPAEGLSNKYDIDLICDKTDGFEILFTDFKNEQKKVRVEFKDSVDAYRNTDESFRVKDINSLSEQYGDDFYGSWTFFKVENSSYAQWLSEQSYGFLKASDLIHFVFIGANCILDVISTYEPKIHLFEEK